MCTRSVEAHAEGTDKEEEDSDEDEDDDDEIYEFMFHPTSTDHARKGNKIKIFLGDLSLLDNSPSKMCIDILTAGYRRTTPCAGNHARSPTPHDDNWAHHTAAPGSYGDPCKNYESNWLMTATNLKVFDGNGEWDDWSIAKRGWNRGRDYSVLVVRSDKKDLTCPQVEALVIWLGQSEDDIVWKMAGLDMRL